MWTEDVLGLLQGKFGLSNEDLARSFLKPLLPPKGRTTSRTIAGRAIESQRHEAMVAARRRHEELRPRDMVLPSTIFGADAGVRVTGGGPPSIVREESSATAASSDDGWNHPDGGPPGRLGFGFGSGSSHSGEEVAGGALARAQSTGRDLDFRNDGDREAGRVPAPRVMRFDSSSSVGGIVDELPASADAARGDGQVAQFVTGTAARGGPKAIPIDSGGQGTSCKHRVSLDAEDAEDAEDADDEDSDEEEIVAAAAKASAPRDLAAWVRRALPQPFLLQRVCDLSGIRLSRSACDDIRN